MLKRNMVFWQKGAATAEALQYRQFYPYATLPHVALMDPATGALAMREVHPPLHAALVSRNPSASASAGERVMVVSQLADAAAFLERVVTFLEVHRLAVDDDAAGRAPPVVCVPAPRAALCCILSQEML